jgi:hypothetical protein
LKQNSQITLDGTRAIERTTPIHPAEWVRRTQASSTQSAERTWQTDRAGKAQESIRRTLSGRRPKRALILDARFLLFTADNFDRTSSDPGCRADEILLHEMIHLAENNFGLYEDVPGNPLKYARSDFLTIIGTNVYSSSLGRGLRADHDKFKPMPSPYAADPGEHATAFRGSYQKVFNNNPPLFHLFKTQSAPWNPFKMFTP